MAKGIAKKVRCIETGEVYNNCAEAGRAIGRDKGAVRRVALGKQESTKGFHFEAVEENTKEWEGLTLTVQNEQGEPIPVIDSREVARMMDKKHRDIIDYIEGNKSTNVTSIAECLAKRGTPLNEYFIESSYLSGTNRKCKCYLVTKKGCELLGNKQQGEKGILFSIAYVERFNAMEKEIKSMSVHKYSELTEKQQCILAVYDGGASAVAASKRLAEIEVQEATAPLKATIEEQQPKVELADERLSMDGCISISDANKTFGLGQGKLMQWARNKGFIDKRKYIKEVNQAGRKYFKVYQTGEYRNIGITEEGMKLIKENKKEINSVKLHRNRK